MVQEIALWSAAHEAKGDESLKGYHALEAIKVELAFAVASGVAQYVRIEGRARDGSIVKPKFLNGLYTAERFAEIRAAGKQAWFDRGGDKFGRTFHALFGKEKTTYSEAVAPKDWADYIREDVAPFMFHEVEIEYDGGKIIDLGQFAFDTSGNHGSKSPKLTWMKGYTGPTVSKFTKTAKASKAAEVAALPRFTDKLGIEVRPDAMVCALLGTEMVLATVVSCSDTGKSIMVQQMGKTELTRVMVGYNVLVLGDETLAQAMVYKLKHAK